SLYGTFLNHLTEPSAKAYPLNCRVFSLCGRTPHKAVLSSGPEPHAPSVIHCVQWPVSLNCKVSLGLKESPSWKDIFSSQWLKVQKATVLLVPSVMDAIFTRVL